MDSHLVCVIRVALVLVKHTIRGVTGVHVDDLWEGSDEVFGGTIVEDKREFAFLGHAH